MVEKCLTPAVATSTMVLMAEVRRLPRWFREAQLHTYFIFQTTVDKACLIPTVATSMEEVLKKQNARHFHHSCFVLLSCCNFTVYYALSDTPRLTSKEDIELVAHNTQSQQDDIWCWSCSCGVVMMHFVDHNVTMKPRRYSSGDRSGRFPRLLNDIR